VELMNTRADAIGCTGTHFANPDGLHDDNHYTTARDLFLIATECMKNETFAEIAGTAQKTIGPTNMQEARKVYTTNMLIFSKNDSRYYSYADGIKTGHTSQAGNCLVSIATKKGSTLISVVLGCPDDANGSSTSFAETKTLFEWAFSNFKSKQLMEKDKAITEIPVRLSTDTDYVVVKTAEELSAVVPIDLEVDQVDMQMSVPESLNAPISAGQVLGTITLSYDGTTYGTINLVAVSDVSMSKVLYYADQLENFFQSTLFKLIVVALVTTLVAYGTIRTIIVRRRAAKKRRMMRRKKYENYNDQEWR
jgi:D-alanyl-D-alanine carboxypeptidase (penicillin-binding protein 5/6)